MIRLQIGSSRAAHQRDATERRATRHAVRLGAVLLTAALATAAEPATGEGLFADRRSARVRDLTACGTTRACLKRRLAESRAVDSALTSSVVATAPTLRRSRWSEAEYDDVRVWIAPGEGTPGWRRANRFMVRDAFHAWTAAGAPVRFVFVPDSARADVHVVWSQALPDRRAGQVTRLTDRRGWLRAATIEMSTRDLRGRPQKSRTVRAVAMHEVGHLLGLEHSGDERDIMAPWVTSDSLTLHDRRMMRVLYDVADSEEDALAEWLVLGGDLVAARSFEEGEGP